MGGTDTGLEGGSRVCRDLGREEGDTLMRLREGPAADLLGVLSSSASAHSSASSSLKVVNVRLRRGCEETGASKGKARGWLKES
jgi:hypothetical protein